ncbi:AGAP010502-PB [Anopheles gambiae str. PEST]|uniref:AGAP010502-PB n=3 Tax=gambiae species complex TaxID=44542 RepID=Q7Q8X3_ANOGA|nr:AGAP010502-PB [Anopheles gambiae str. PEST]
MRRKCQTSPVRAIFPGHPECCTIGYHVRLHLKFPDKINSLHRRRHRPRCLRWFDSFTHGNRSRRNARTSIEMTNILPALETISYISVARDKRAAKGTGGKLPSKAG